MPWSFDSFLFLSSGHRSAAVNFKKPSTRLNSHQQLSTPAKGRETATPPMSNHTTKHMFFCSPCSELFVDFLVGSDSNWNRPISSKDSQLKHLVDTLAFGCAFCYGILIPCCLLYLYGKQHIVLEANRTRTIT